MRHSRAQVILASLMAMAIVVGPAFAQGRGHGNERAQGRGVQSNREQGALIEFGERERIIVREYYGGEFESGRSCPPGLAKKGNGCMPPGQAKKWAIGRPLPRDVIFYEVPQQLVIRIGVPPAGYRYVRVANDVLMIAIGTGMVMSAIEDLGRR